MTNIVRLSTGRLAEVPVRRTGWTATARRTFLAALARTANVTVAAAEAGRDRAGAYLLRRRDGEFARLWQDAQEIGYLRLEDELLARALGQAPCGDNPAEVPTDGAEAARPFDPGLAMAVLKLRARQGGSPARRAPTGAGQAEVDAELMKRLDALAEKLGAEKLGAEKLGGGKPVTEPGDPA